MKSFRDASKAITPSLILVEGYKTNEVARSNRESFSLIQPRKKTSKKRTEIPSELIEQIEDLLLANFREPLKRRLPIVSGFIYPEEIVLGVGLSTPKQLKQPRFDVSIDYDVKKDNATKTIHLLVDLLAGLFEKLVNDEEDHDFPRIWEEFQFEKKTVYLQYGTTNLDLEKEANELLGEFADEGLLQFDDEEEAYGTADEMKARLGIDPDEESEDDSKH